MNVPINDDFDKEYKVEAWKGFDLWEVAALGVTVGIAAGVACFLRFIVGLSLTTSFYAGIIPAVPVAALAFFRSGTGQTLPEHLETLRYRKATEKLAWQSMEYDRAWKAYCKAEQKVQKIEAKEAEAKEKVYAMEAAKLAAMKKTYKKRIRKKHREEARARKRAGHPIETTKNTITAVTGKFCMDEAMGSETAGQEISEEGTSVSAGVISPAADMAPGENGSSTGAESGAATDADSARIAGTDAGCPSGDDEAWDRIQARKSEIRCLSAKLAESTREHETRIGKKGG